MNLVGEYTRAGAQLAALIQAGSATLSITRAAGGAGHTASEAIHMERECQPLAITAHSVDGATLTVPATLHSIEAEGAYMFAEIGLYARDAQGEEILYKLYRFDQGISVSPDCDLTATFYLNDMVVSGSPVAVTVSPTGLLTLEDAAAILDKVGHHLPNTSRITCAAGQLINLINAMPKLVAQNTEVVVTAGTVPGNLILSGFYGPGTLLVVGSSRITVDGYIDLYACNVAMLNVENFTTSPTKLRPTGFSAYGSAGVSVRNCGSKVRLKNITVAEGSSKTTHVGFYIEASHCMLLDILAKTRLAPIVGYRMAQVHFRSFSTTSSMRL